MEKKSGFWYNNMYRRNWKVTEVVFDEAEKEKDGEVKVKWRSAGKGWLWISVRGVMAQRRRSNRWLW